MNALQKAFDIAEQNTDIKPISIDEKFEVVVDYITEPMYNQQTGKYDLTLFEFSDGFKVVLKNEKNSVEKAMILHNENK